MEPYRRYFCDPACPEHDCTKCASANCSSHPQFNEDIVECRCVWNLKTGERYPNKDCIVEHLDPTTGEER